MMGEWEQALKAGEMVLQKKPTNTKAMLVKGEALFNLCQFEHALVWFYRGQVCDLKKKSDHDTFKVLMVFF
jgi:hypothetical protein